MDGRLAARLDYTRLRLGLASAVCQDLEVDGVAGDLLTGLGRQSTGRCAQLEG